MNTTHEQTKEQHPDQPWKRTACTCGWRGVWLKNDVFCKPCPRAVDAARAAKAVR